MVEPFCVTLALCATIVSLILIMTAFCSGAAREAQENDKEELVPIKTDLELFRDHLQQQIGDLKKQIVPEPPPDLEATGFKVGDRVEIDPKQAGMVFAGRFDKIIELPKDGGMATIELEQGLVFSHPANLKLKPDEEQPVLHNRGDRIQWELADGTIHRMGGPAVEVMSGPMMHCKYWRQHGKLHRLDGPTVESGPMTAQYWVNGMRITKDKFKKDYGCS